MGRQITTVGIIMALLVAIMANLVSPAVHNALKSGLETVEVAVHLRHHKVEGGVSLPPATTTTEPTTTTTTTTDTTTTTTTTPPPTVFLYDLQGSADLQPNMDIHFAPADIDGIALPR